MKSSLMGMFNAINERNDLFNLWLQKDRDFDQVELQVNRVRQHRQEAASTEVLWNRTQLEEKYSKEDVDDLIARCVRLGKYQDDPNFPGVERLRQYELVQEVTRKTSDALEDSTSLNAGMMVSATDASSLLAEGLEFQKKDPMELSTSSL